MMVEKYPSFVDVNLENKMLIFKTNYIFFYLKYIFWTYFSFFEVFQVFKKWIPRKECLLNAWIRGSLQRFGILDFKRFIKNHFRHFLVRSVSSANALPIDLPLKRSSHLGNVNYQLFRCFKIYLDLVLILLDLIEAKI